MLCSFLETDYDPDAVEAIYEVFSSPTLLFNIAIWVNYNDLTATSLGIMVSKGNHPQMALIQVSEIL